MFSILVITINLKRNHKEQQINLKSTKQTNKSTITLQWLTQKKKMDLQLFYFKMIETENTWN